jgi:glycosyltransferase involved in cell wall biosynthesis
VSSHVPYGQAPLRAVHVLGAGEAMIGDHVRSLAVGLTARGVRVTVAAPGETEHAHRYTAAGARHVPVPQRGDPAGLVALRTACTGADLVHAHGLDAGLRTALALGGRRTPLVVTWHDHAQAGGVLTPWVRLLERRAVRAASVVLCTSPALVDRARTLGARDARLAMAAPPAPPGPAADDPGHADALRHKERAELGAVGRPLVIAGGALRPHRGYETLLDATRAWRVLDPAPLLVITGEGPLRGRLQQRIDEERLPVRLLGRRDDPQGLLAAADLAVLPAGGTGRSPGFLLAQAALHACVPLVACDGDGVLDLVGDAAQLVPHGDAASLASAVTVLLADPARRARLADLGAAQTAAWPSEDETVTQVLSVYDELTQPTPR